MIKYDKKCHMRIDAMTKSIENELFGKYVLKINNTIQWDTVPIIQYACLKIHFSAC